MRPEAAAAVEAVTRRADEGASRARARIESALGEIDVAAAMAGLLRAARLTVNFHPDRSAERGTVIEALRRDGIYRSQFSTGISNGSRSAIPGGIRSEWERQLFDDAYANAAEYRPIYGTLDVFNDTRGGSPGFGSCHLVLDARVAQRCTFSVGDTHVGPTDVGTAASGASILAGLAQEAARGSLLGRDIGLDGLRSLLDGVERPATTDRLLESYVEAQIHGGVDIGRDVIELVADPAFVERDTGRHLEELAEMTGAPLRWHAGNALPADEFPTDFRPSDLPGMAREIARPDGIVDAAVIGDRARAIEPGPPAALGDQSDHPLQWVKHLWQALVVFGSDADPN